MTTYLPFYSKGDSGGAPALTRDPSCVFYLRSWAKDGTTFQSDDMYGHNCIKYGALWKPQGLSFDGTDDWINAGYNPVLGFLGGITMGVWYKRSIASLSYHRIVNKQFTSTSVAGCQYHLGLYQSTMEYRWGVAGAFDYVPAKVCPLNTWVFYVGTWNLATAKVYENAALIGTYTAAGVMRSEPAYPLTIACSSGTSYFASGIVGEVFIFNRALAPSEIGSLYRATSGRYL